MTRRILPLAFSTMNREYKLSLLIVGLLMFSLAGLQAQITSFPYYEDFEGESICSNDLLCQDGQCDLVGDFQNFRQDDIDWIVGRGGTTSSETGPDDDHTFRGGNYLYTEASCFRVGYPNKTAILLSPHFDLTQVCSPVLRFYYHMYGRTMGTMYLDVDPDGNGNWQNVGSRTDNRDWWQAWTFQLGSYAGKTNFRFRIRGVTGSSFMSDMAIDDISIRSRDQFYHIASCHRSDAAASVYANNTWTDGSNDGSGFGPWDLNRINTVPNQPPSWSAGFFTASSTGNGQGGNAADGDIDTNGNAFGIYANSNATAEAIRPFSEPFLPGSRFSFEFDNGWVDPPGVVGAALQNTQGDNLFEFLFINFSPTYSIVDANGFSPIPVNYTIEGLRIETRNIGGNKIEVRVTNKETGSVHTFTSSLINPQNGNQDIARVRFFNFSAGGGTERDLYVNKLRVCYAKNGCPGPVITLQAGNGLCRDRIEYPSQIFTVDDCQGGIDPAFLVEGPRSGSLARIGTHIVSYFSRTEEECTFEVNLDGNVPRPSILPSNVCAGQQLDIASLVRDYTMQANHYDFYQWKLVRAGRRYRHRWVHVGSTPVFRGIARNPVYVYPNYRENRFKIVVDYGIRCERVTNYRVGMDPACSRRRIAAIASLQGSFDVSAGLMRDDLRASNLLPTTEPYSAQGYTYVLGGHPDPVDPAVFAVTGNDAIVDWVVVELRDATDPTTVVYSRPALLQRDGDIVEIDGVSMVEVNSIPYGKYYVAVLHRNHLALMSDQPVDIYSNTLDFTDPNLATYGGANGRTTQGGKSLMIAGDADGNGQVQNTDDVLEWAPKAGASGYNNADYNLDGQVQNTDKIMLWNGNVGRGTAVPR